MWFEKKEHIWPYRPLNGPINFHASWPESWAYVDHGLSKKHRLGASWMVHTPTFWILNQCNITLVLQLWWLRWPRKARHAIKLWNRLSIYDGKRYRIGSWYSASARSRWGITVSWHFWLGAFGNNMPSAKLRLTHWKSTTTIIAVSPCLSHFSPGNSASNQKIRDLAFFAPVKLRSHRKICLLKCWSSLPIKKRVASRFESIW